MTFDKAAWDQGRGNYDGKNPRLDLVAQLESIGIEPGTPRAKVHELLGPPDRPVLAAGASGEGWYLGRNDMAPDFLILTIHYDADGRVTKVNTTKG